MSAAVESNPNSPRSLEPRRVVIDTDAANEVDDQFAIAWALMSPDQLMTEGIHAPPFCHGRYFDEIQFAASQRGGTRSLLETLAGNIGPERRARLTKERPASAGEEKSRAEIHRLLDVMALENPPPGKIGSHRFMESPTDVVESDAAHHLIERAHAGRSPLRRDNRRADQCRGFAPHGPEHRREDGRRLPRRAAERVSSRRRQLQPRAGPTRLQRVRVGAPLVYQPGYQVAEVLGFSLPDCERWVKGHGPLGDLLHEIYVNNPIDHDVERVGRSWVIWDIIAIAWLLDPSWVPTFETTRSRVTDAHTWEPIGGTMAEAFRVRRDDIFNDLLGKLHRFADRQ